MTKPLTSSLAESRISPEQWRGEGRWFVHDGHRIFYRLAGHGQTLLCLHGFPTSSWDWHKLWLPLTQRFQVLAPDMLGMGYSSKPRGPYSVTLQADIVLALMRSLGLQSFHALVHDYGTLVVQELLDRGVGSGIELKSVVCLNGSIFADLSRPRRIQWLLASRVGRVLAPLLPQRIVLKNISSIFGTRRPANEQLLADFAKVLTDQDGFSRIPALLSYLHERTRSGTRWSAAWVHSTVPRLLISGEDDPIAGMTVVSGYRERVPHAELLVLDGVGHYAHLEDPERVLAALRSFHDHRVTRGATS